MHAHDEQQVDVAEVRLDRFVRSLRFERKAAAHAERRDLLEQRTRIAELHVHGEAVGPRFRERLEQCARVVDHEVAVEKKVGVRTQRRDNRRADREVRHVVTVHAVDVQQLAGIGDAGHARGEVREVGGKDRRRDFDHASHVIGSVRAPG